MNNKTTSITSASQPANAVSVFEKMTHHELQHTIFHTLFTDPLVEANTFNVVARVCKTWKSIRNQWLTENTRWLINRIIEAKASGRYAHFESMMSYLNTLFPIEKQRPYDSIALNNELDNLLQPITAPQKVNTKTTLAKQVLLHNNHRNLTGNELAHLVFYLDPLIQSNTGNLIVTFPIQRSIAIEILYIASENPTLMDQNHNLYVQQCVIAELDTQYKYFFEEDITLSNFSILKLEAILERVITSTQYQTIKSALKFFAKLIDNSKVRLCFKNTIINIILKNLPRLEQYTMNMHSSGKQTSRAINILTKAINHEQLGCRKFDIQKSLKTHMHTFPAATREIARKTLSSIGDLS